MISPVFVDTSALYALTNRNDSHHSAAREFVTRHTGSLITSEYVFDETVTSVRYDLGYAVARALGERLRASQFCSIIPVEPEDLSAAWEIFCRYDDQDFSFTDCTSFALMHHLGLQEAFTFDHHFRIAGFAVVPKAPS